MRKIVVDACSLIENRTGIGNYLYRILEELRKNKNYYIVLVSNNEIIFNDYENVKKISCNTVTRKFLKGPLWMYLYFLIVILREKPQYIWGVNGIMPIYFGSAKKILMVHDFTHKLYPETQKMGARIYRSFAQPLSIFISDYFVPISNSTKNDLLKYYPHIKKREVKVIHPPAEYIKDIQKIPRPTFDYGKYLVVVGTLEPRKNLNILVSSFIYFKQTSTNSKLKLLLIGGEGWKTSIDSCHDDLIKLGYVEDKEKYSLLRGSVAFIMPSLYEGFGMPVLEAQTIGVSVIVNKVPSLIEAADDVCISLDMNQSNLVTLFGKLEADEASLVCRYFDEIKFHPESVCKIFENFIFS